MRLSTHFTLDEMTRSDTAARHGFDNTPEGPELENLERTAALMERVRAMLSHPIVVHSGYRSPAINTLVGGAPTSAHCRGLACDFVCPGYGSPSDVAGALEWSLNALDVDQLILEYGWVHIGLAEAGKTPRNQRLTKRSARAPYEPGIHR